MAVIEISDELMAKLDECAPAAGYQTGAEFAVAILDREVGKITEDESTKKIEERLRGLGYIS
ncbi:MAG: hypothetical protein J7M38_04295 [Armatimonadetes bacterium]|nr:hypothetical protein [Armatimonadota bacterium]